MNKAKYAVFTMDIESFADTDCIRNSNYEIKDNLLDGFGVYMNILNKYHIKSTLFTVGDLAPNISQNLKKHINEGHRLALHSYEHIPPMSIDPKLFRQKIMWSRERLSKMFDTEIVGFRAPCFSLDNVRLNILKELGFKYDSSYLGFNARHTVKLDLSDFKEVLGDVYNNNGFYEFGISKQKIFGKSFPVSGGGYVRISNWAFIKSLISQYIKRNDYYVFYLHPFELTNKRIPSFKKLSAHDQYYIKTGINTFSQKIEHIIKMLKKYGYKFVTFEELYDILQNENN